ncbi:hypothetical protein HNQ77_001658 [Silvibacterium bohemicum]|uniref:Uncharacterized protein n=1 Tax=Silvibacterium bohemicum TaxID=1577686 RepID=A0A841JVE0_9BACT|nr:hypothetical protein [Silvibacterium bohemicum]MBB6143709.1 hypothetical protein [Silvibacterium bohemicum]
MNMDMRYFVAAGVALLTILIVLAVVYYRRAYKASRSSWQELLDRLILINREGVKKIAMDTIDVHGNRRDDEHARELDADEIWQLIGGLEGVETLQHNSRVLVDVAAYLHTWYPEASAIAEELRLSAREIAWHVSSLQDGAKAGNLGAWFRAYAQNAAATYYLMTRQLLSLCENGDKRLLTDLQRVL